MFYYPSPSVSLLEHIIVDNWGAYASNFSSAITPCTNYVTEIGEPAVNSGRTTSAQWIRVIFHDFVTANVTAGTGGVDASIGFETFREENKGSAFNDSFTFWRPFVNEFVPMADLVALGTVMSVNLCGDRYIPFSPGRRDALGADPTTGVPEPGTSVEETLEQFGRAGLSREEAIGLTACGHTLGSSHHSGFPEVAPESAVDPNNTNGGVNFDSSRGMFDSLVVHEYIDGTGNLGGPLVTSFNESSRSDLRLYESDGNATMRMLYARGNDFQDTCVELFTRMMNTVPAYVTLRDPITPMSIKPINTTWDVIDDAQLALSGTIRMLKSEVVPDENLTMVFPNGYSETLTFEQEAGSSTFGVTRFAPFSVDRSKIRGASAFTISGTGIQDETYEIQDEAFIIPSLTAVVGNTVNVTVAVKRGAVKAGQGNISVRIAAPTTQPLTLAPKIVTSDMELDKAKMGIGEMDIFLGVASIQQPTGAVSLQLLADGGLVDVLLLDAGVAGW